MLLCFEGAGELGGNGVDDFLFEAGSEPLGEIVVDHGVAAFVAAFFENALAGDVAAAVVGIAIEPKAGAVEFAFEAEGVVDDGFAGEEDDGEGVAEDPGLDRVIDFFGQGFAAVEAGEVDAGVVADGVLFLGAHFPFGAGARCVEGEIEAPVMGGWVAGDRFEIGREKAFYFLRDLVALVPANVGFGSGDARVGIGISAAADRGERDRAGEKFLDAVLGEAGPVAADFVVGERDAMAGVAEIDRAEFAAGFVHGQEGEIMIDGTSFGAAVGGKSDRACAPGETGRSSILECGQGDVLESVDEFGGVAIDVVLMVVRDGNAEESWTDVLEHRRGVGMSRGDGEALAFEGDFFFEAARDLGGDFVGDAEVVGGDEKGGALLVAGKGEGFGEDTLGDAFGFGAPEAEAAESDGVVGGDVGLGDADTGGWLIGGEGRRAKGQGEHQEQTATPEERVHGGWSVAVPVPAKRLFEVVKAAQKLRKRRRVCAVSAQARRGFALIRRIFRWHGS
jgi:hypothetical protein